MRSEGDSSPSLYPLSFLRCVYHLKGTGQYEGRGEPQRAAVGLIEVGVGQVGGVGSHQISVEYQPRRFWKRQQKILWKAVRVQTKRCRDRFRIADLFTDERRTEAILEFLESTDVGRKAREEEREQAKRAKGRAA